MPRHNCVPWTALRINCPQGLLERAQQRGGIVQPEPGEEEEIVHDEVRNLVPSDGFELERLVFIELEKAAKAKTARQKTVEKLAERDRGVFARPALVPVEILREAARQGQTGSSAAVWVAAAIALAAVVGAFGAGAGSMIPGIISTARRGAPMHFDASGLGIRRKFARSQSGSGEFFPGILG